MTDSQRPRVVGKTYDRDWPVFRVSRLDGSLAEQDAILELFQDALRAADTNPCGFRAARLRLSPHYLDAVDTLARYVLGNHGAAKAARDLAARLVVAGGRFEYDATRGREACKAAAAELGLEVGRISRTTPIRGEVAPEPPELCALCGLPENVHGHGELEGRFGHGADDPSHRFEPKGGRS